jgi:glycosyltransferase involved in cell wall biosynthesis
MTEISKVEVCIPAYNGANFISEAIQSVMEQSFKDITIIASDNNSSDETHEILQAWSQKVPMRILRQTKTLDLKNHFNAVLEEVRAPYYMLLCHDDYFCSPDAIASAVAILDAEPDVSAVYGDMNLVNEHRRVLMRQRFSRRGRVDGDKVGRQSLRSMRNLFGVAVLVRRSDLGELRYDTNLDYIIDLDLSWAISKTRPFYHIEEPLIAYRVHGTNNTWDLDKESERSFLTMAKKHGLALTERDRRRLRQRNWLVVQQRRAFGAYSRLVSRLPRPSPEAHS